MPKILMIDKIALKLLEFINLITLVLLAISTAYKGSWLCILLVFYFAVLLEIYEDCKKFEKEAEVARDKLQEDLEKLYREI